jgi:hypothetical protein
MGARTVLPAGTPAFSRYRVVFSRDGFDPVTVEDAGDLAGSGTSRELAGGTWTVTVSAYRTFTVTGGTPGREYLAAGGSETLEISAGTTTPVKVGLAPVPATEAGALTEKGIFTYKVAFPAGASAALIFGGEAAVPLVSGEEVSVEKAPGYYDLYLLATGAEGLNAGVSEKAHIYAGLESKLDYAFTEADFTATVFLAGTLSTLPQGITINGGTLTGYSNADYSGGAVFGPVAVAAMGDGWIAGVPAADTGAGLVYLSLTAEGSDGKTYLGSGDSGGAITEAGKRGIVLSDAAAPAEASGLAAAPGDTRAVLSWTDPADPDLDHLEISWTWAGGSGGPVSAPKSSAENRANSRTVEGLTNGTLYTFALGTVDTAGIKSGGITVDATPDDGFTEDVGWADNPEDIFPEDFLWTGAGTAAQTWDMRILDKRIVKFGVYKSAAQEITVGGADADLVVREADGTAFRDDEDLANDTLAVFTIHANRVDPAERLDTQFAGGDFAFTLNVAETGRTGKTIGVSLRSDITPDMAVFKVSGDGELTRETGVKMWTRSRAVSPREVVFGEEEGTRLIDMLVHVDQNRELGDEYLIRVAADEQIPQVVLTFPLNDTVTRLRLRGTGGERIISYNNTINDQYRYAGFNLYPGPDDLLDRPSEANWRGLIVQRRGILQLEQDITIQGVDTNHITCLLQPSKGTLVMKAGSAVKGHRGANASPICAPIFLHDSNGRSWFKMEGGEISGNTNLWSVVSFSAGDNIKTGVPPGRFQKTGGLIRDNYDRDGLLSSLVVFGEGTNNINPNFSFKVDNTREYFVPAAAE